MRTRPPAVVVTRSVILAIAVEAEADPRTVLKAIAGGVVRGDVMMRIRRAAAVRGVVLP